MASFKGVSAVMGALEEFFKGRLPPELKQGGNASVKLLGSADIAKPINGNVLGIYLHRISVDAHGRNRYLPPKGSESHAPTPELPVNLHFLLLATGNSPNIEADLLSWGMMQLATQAQLDVAHLGEADSGWGERELVSISPEDLSTEDLMRIWEAFDAKYTVTTPYVARTVRLRLQPERTEGPEVVTRVFPTGTL